MSEHARLEALEDFLRVFGQQERPRHEGGTNDVRTPESICVLNGQDVLDFDDPHVLTIRGSEGVGRIRGVFAIVRLGAVVRATVRAVVCVDVNRPVVKKGILGWYHVSGVA